PSPGSRLLERGVDRGDHGLRPARVPCLRAGLTRRGSSSSTSRRDRPRSLSWPSCAGERARAPDTRELLTHSPQGCCSCCPEGQLNLPRASLDSTSATSRTST